MLKRARQTVRALRQFSEFPAFGSLGRDPVQLYTFHNGHENEINWPSARRISATSQPPLPRLDLAIPRFARTRMFTCAQSCHSAITTLGVRGRVRGSRPSSRRIVVLELWEKWTRIDCARFTVLSTQSA